MKETGIDNVAPAGLSSRIYAFTVSYASLAYGYAHFTPAAFFVPSHNELALPQMSRRDDRCITAGVAIAKPAEASVSHTLMSRRDNKYITAGVAIAKPAEASVSHTLMSRRDNICITAGVATAKPAEAR